MRRLPLLVLVLILAVAVAGCDFTPTLDIATPPFEAGLVVQTILFADSVATVNVTRARDPYGARTGAAVGREGFETVADAALTLRRDGGPPQALRYVSRRCVVDVDFTTDPPSEVTAECGFYVSDVPISGGSAYTLRAEAPGLPPVEARVRVPARIPATATIEPGTPIDGQRTNRITIRFRDPAGMGNSYGLDALLDRTFTVTDTGICADPRCQTTRDTTYTARYKGQTSFSTADVILLAGLRGLPGGASFVTFTDQLFDGEERSFTIDARVYEDQGNTPLRRSVRLIAFDRPIVDAYEQAYFSLGEENPFQEPFDLPSNVTGGYGLVGAAAITEIDLGAP